MPAIKTTKPPTHVGASDVLRRAKHALQNSPYVELRRIACAFDEGLLTLDGQVSSFYMKQVAQTVVRPIDGVRQVVNKLEVPRHDNSYFGKD